jgi:hypothetical protein
MSKDFESEPRELSLEAKAALNGYIETRLLRWAKIIGVPSLVAVVFGIWFVANELAKAPDVAMGKILERNEKIGEALFNSRRDLAEMQNEITNARATIARLQIDSATNRHFLERVRTETVSSSNQLERLKDDNQRFATEAGRIKSEASNILATVQKDVKSDAMIVLITELNRGTNATAALYAIADLRRTVGVLSNFFNEAFALDDTANLRVKKPLVPMADIKSPRDGGLHIIDDNSDQYLTIDPNGAGEISYFQSAGQKGTVRVFNFEKSP